MATGDNVPGIGEPRTPTSADSFDSLVLALRNFDENTRINAVQNLGNLKESRAVPQLLGRFKNDKSPKVRYHAAEALYKLGSDEAWPAFASSLNKSIEDSDLVRAKAAEILGWVGDIQFTTELFSALSDSSQIVWEKAANALGVIKNPTEVDRLISCLNIALDERYSYAKRNATPFIAALVAMDSMVITQVLLSSNNCKHNIKRLSSSSTYEAESQHIFNANERKFLPRNSEEAFFEDRVEVLYRIGPPSIPIIKDVLGSQTRPQALFEIASLALSKIHDVDALSFLCDLAVKNQYDSVRWISTSGIISIFRTNMQLAFATLTSIINNEKKNEIREKAIEGVGVLGNPQAVSLLGKILLDDDDLYVRLAAAKALGEIHSPLALDALVSALGTDRNLKVQITSAVSLGEIYNRDAISFLDSTAKNDPSDDVRQAAKIALSKYQ